VSWWIGELANWQVAAGLELASMGELPQAPSEERLPGPVRSLPPGTSGVNCRRPRVRNA